MYWRENTHKQINRLKEMCDVITLDQEFYADDATKRTNKTNHKSRQPRTEQPIHIDMDNLYRIHF